MASDFDLKCEGEDSAFDQALSGVPTTKKLNCKQAFNDEWLNDPELKDWIQHDPNEKYVVMCTICNAKLTNTNRKGLIAHKSTSKHLRNSEAKKCDDSMVNISDSNMLDDGDLALSGPPTKKKKQAFNDEWLKDPELKDWIQCDPNDKYAVLCNICNTKFVTMNRQCFIAHKSTSKHLKNSEAKQSDTSIANISDSNILDGLDSSVSGSPKKRKSYYKQAFNDEWLKDPELNDWIQGDPNDKYVVMCTICDTKLVNTNRHGLITHKSTSKHMINSEAKKKDDGLAKSFESKWDGEDLAFVDPVSTEILNDSQAFNDEWLEDPELKEWIQCDPNDKQVVLCKICDTNLVNTSRHGLIAHKNTSEHVRNSEAKKCDDSMANISDSNMLDDSHLSGPPTKKKKQAFNDEWLKDPELKDWIQCDPNDMYAALCNICNTKFVTMNHQCFIAHKSTSKHVRNSEAKKNDASMLNISDSNMMDGLELTVSGSPSKKKYYKQAFNDKWLKDPELKGWIQSDPNDKYAVLCKICNTKLVNSNRKGLIAHKTTSKHVRNSETMKSDDSMTSISDSNMLDDEDSAALSGPPKEKKSYYKQAFNDEWLKVPELKDWIQRDPNDKYAVLCEICNIKLVNANRKSLIAHKSTSKHVGNEAKKSNDRKMNISDSNMLDGLESAGPSTEKKSSYKQAFNDEWLKDPELKDWIQGDPNDKYVVMCNICDTKLANTNRRGLIAHKSTGKHVRNSKATKNDISVRNSFESKLDGGESALVDTVSTEILNDSEAFNDEWLMDPELKDWIQRDPTDKYVVLCNICNTKLVNSSLVGLIAHKTTRMHLRNSEAKKSDDSMANISDSDMLDDGESSLSGPPTKKKKQAVNGKWLKDPELKDWIQHDPNDKYAVLCNICNTKLTNTSRKGLIAHKSSSKHVRNSEAKKCDDSTANISDSDMLDDGESALSGPPPKKKKQAFNEKWLKDPELKDWIQHDPNEKYVVLCRICNTKLTNTNRKGLIAHKSSSKHLRNSEAKKCDDSMANISDSDMLDDGDSTVSCPPTKKKSYCKQAFNDEWLKDPELKDWIQHDPTEKCKVLCTICNTKLVNTNRTFLIAHKNTRKHVSNSESKESKVCIKNSSDFGLDGGDSATICDRKIVNTKRRGLIAHKRTSKHVRNREAKRSAATHAATKKKSYYKQAFNDEWLKDPELMDWIQRVPNEKYNVVCKICDRKLVNTNRRGLIVHKRTSKHVRNCDANRTATTHTAGSKDDVQSSGYSDQLLESFGSFLRDDRFCDTVIVVGEKQLKAHSVVLAAASSVFREALLASNVEPGLRLLNMSGYDFDVLEAVLSIIYTGKLAVKMQCASPEKLSKLLAALEDLGLGRYQYRTIVSDAEEISNGNLHMKMEEGNVPGETSRGVEDVAAFATHPSDDSLMVNEVTQGWVMHSETGVHAVETPASTLAQAQSGVHKYTAFKKSERFVEHGLLNYSNRANCEESFRRTEATPAKFPDYTVRKRERQRLLCTTCGKTFARKRNLISHERVHTGEKPFTCPICHKSIANNLTRHMRSHTADKHPALSLM